MKARNVLISVSTILAGAAAAGAAIAADFGPPPPAPPVVVEPVYVQPSYRCWRWSQKCDFRWGVGSPRYFRCMWRHGC